jgi:threonine dehydrogenase-like Zn-dependent dehydrogenase
MVRNGGTVVLGGLKGGKELSGLVVDELVFRSIRLQGIYTVDSVSYAEAIRMIEADPRKFAPLHSKSFPLDRAEEAIARLAGSDGEPPALHVAIEPRSK